MSSSPRKARVAENAAPYSFIYNSHGNNKTTYSLAGADAALFEISAKGVVFIKASPDYEARSSYSIDVVATRGTHERVEHVLVTVTNLNDNAPVFTSGATGAVAENAATSTVVYTAAATDADHLPGAVKYSLGGADAGLLSISSAGQVTLKTSADFEAKASYNFNVIASDGVHSTTQAVVVVVGNLDDNAPVFTSAHTGTVTEGAPTDTPIYTAATTDLDNDGAPAYSLGGADAALLDISPDGVVTLKATADFEVKPSYSFSVIANDGTHTTSQAVVVDVVNVAPTLAITSSADVLADGGTSTITFTFSEDPGATFVDADIAVTGGALGALAGSGLTRTATFTAADSATLSTGATISVLPANFTDLAGKAGDASQGTPSVHIDTVFNQVLFVGNSATFGRVDPVLSYNSYDAVTNPGGVHDLTSADQGGTFTDVTGSNLYEPHDWGGVPGLVDMFAQQVGLSWDVSISARNAATLEGQYKNSSPAHWDLRGNIASQDWDLVVLQDQTDEPLPGGYGSITFAAGSSTASLIVTPTGDGAQEYDETLALKLATSGTYRVGTSATITTTVLNDDPTGPVINPALPTVTLTANPGSVAEDSANNLVYTFTRSGPTTSDLIVTFNVARDGSTSPSVSTTITSSQDLEMYTAAGAIVPTTTSNTSPYRFTDGSGLPTSGQGGGSNTSGAVSFTSNTGNITIKAGQTSASITMDPHNDTAIELDESIRITLTGTAYNIGTAGPVTTTIVNDDFAGGVDTSLPNVTLALSTAASVYESAGQSLVYTFTRSGDTTAPLTVNFNESGTATYFASDASKSDFGITTAGASGATLVTTSAANADIPGFETYATLIEDYIHNGAQDTTTIPGTTIPANPNADADTDVYLYATWARPDMIAGAIDMITSKTLVTSGPNTGANGGTGAVTPSSTQATAYYLNLESMSEDLTDAYTHLATVNPDFVGVAPVSTAFMNAVLEGLAVRDPYTQAFTSSVSSGDINLWFDDNLHASKYGSYLAGLTLFETLTGMDARVLGAGDRVAADLGIDAATAVALQEVASATLNFDASYHWTRPGAVTDLGGTDAGATLATAGAFTFVDPTNTAHTVTVQSQDGNLGTLTASVRSDGHSGQVNWLYTVNNQVVDPLLASGEQRVERFTIVLDDGNGHTSTEIVGVNLYGAAEV
ncbi:MAG: cadherin domain-containing protein [Pseudomonadota bacterium]